MRVIRSTTNPQQQLAARDADPLVEVVTAAVEGGGWVRKSYANMTVEEVCRRQVTARVGDPLSLLVALVSFTDPHLDQHRWAVLHEWATEPRPEHDQRPTDGYELFDTDDLDEAIARYEQIARAESDAGDPWTFDYTDVRGIAGADRSQHDPNVRARLIEAGLLHRRWSAANAVLDRLGDQRVIAIGRAVRAYGHGGQMALARKLGLKQSTIAAAVRRAGRLCTWTVLVDQLDPARPDARWSQFAAVLSVTDYTMTSPERAALASVPAELLRMSRSVRVRVWRGSAVDADSVTPDHEMSGTAAEIAARLDAAGIEGRRS